MSNCYRFEKVSYNVNNYFDKSISATYIITLENNGRLDNIIEQLTKFQPTNNTFILFNKGFKSCDKTSSYINKTNLDLVDAYLKVFEHANDNNFGNIIILEDDFIFSDQITSELICDDINEYITENQNSEFTYFLGCLPLLQIPLGKHYKLIISTGTHAVIYTKLFVHNHRPVQDTSYTITDWDGYLRNFSRITYNTCLCYQLFPITENSANWGFGSQPIKYLIKIFGLDTSIEPGYTIFYCVSKLLFYLILLILLILLIVIIKFFYNK